MGPTSTELGRKRAISFKHVLKAVPTVILILFGFLAWFRPDLLDSRSGSIALWTMTGIAIVAGALAVARAAFLPILARIFVIVVSLYALTAINLAFREGIRYSAWLGGDSAWRLFPGWLRGGFLGVFVVLPTAIVILALKAGVRRLRMTGSGWREANRALALALCVAIAAVHVPVANSSKGSSGTPPGQPPISSSGTLKLPVLALPDPSPLKPAEFLTRANEIAARVTRMDWDVDAKADSLALGIEPAFAFVRDAIRYEAYSGVLRGAVGTYATRAGNAADRALLLTRLLARKGVPTRFALGTLSEAVRERLFLSLFVNDAAGTKTAQRLEMLSSNGTTLQERLLRRAKRDYDVVRGILGDRLPPVTKPTREDVLAEMNPHTWVQAQVDGRWIDLDPSFPDGTVGTTVATFERSVPELPADVFQRVRVHLYAEHYSGGSLVPSTLLDITRNTVDLIDSQIFLIHTATDPGNPMGGLGTAMARALGRRDSVWTPILSIDGEFTVGTTVNVSSSTAVFVAEWLEFELSWPNGRREVTRRPLVDRAGAAWRAAHPLDIAKLRSLESGDTGPFSMQALHNVWFSAGKHNLANFSQGLQYVAASAVLELTKSATPDGEAADLGALTSGTAEPETRFPESLFPFALQNLAWMVWTDHVVIPALNDATGLKLYADSPRIAIFTAAPTSEDGLEVVSDFRRDELRGVATDSTQRRALAEKKLWFGLLQGSLEQEGLTEFIAGGGGDPASVQTTSSSLSADGVVVLVGRDALSSLPPSPHPESKARLSSALRAGNVVVAPLAGLDHRYAWWEIVDGTGDTRPVAELGLNAGRGGFRPPNPLKTRITPQTNSFGGPRAYEIDPKTYASVRSDAQRARTQARSIVKSQKRGALEYLLIILAIAATVGTFIWLGTHVALTVYGAAEQLSAPA